MSAKFTAGHGLVIVKLRITGPSGRLLLRVALDTGATTTTLSSAPLIQVGYDPNRATDRVQITTGSGLETVTRIAVSKLQALGREEVRFPVLCHTLPSSAGVDGVLGLDFFRGRILKIDFQQDHHVSMN